MVGLIQFVADYALWFYLFLGLIILALLRAIQVAMRERSRSIFALEKENASRSIIRSLNFIALVLLIGVAVFYVSNVLVVQVPQAEVSPTPTAVTALPPTPTMPRLLDTPTPTPTRAATATPTALAAVNATPEPVDTPVAQSGGIPPNCPNPGSTISQPLDGAQVTGVIPVNGAAYVDNFSYYKLEFRVPGAEAWSFIQDYPSPNYGGQLGAWNTATVPPGVYEFRLVVVDQIGNYPTPCTIRLVVQ